MGCRRDMEPREYQVVVTNGRAVGIFIVDDLEQQSMFMIGDRDLRAPVKGDITRIRAFNFQVGEVVGSIFWQIAEYEAPGLHINSELHITYLKQKKIRIKQEGNRLYN